MLGNTYGTIGSTATAFTWTTSNTTSTASHGYNDIIKYCKQAQRDWSDACRIVERIPDKLPAGKRSLELPDGAKLIVDDAGNYRIEDASAKVTYKANRLREFSPHLNASDMLAQFVSYIGSLPVKRDEALGLPLHLFISWLILEAAQRDGDQIPTDVLPTQADPVLRLAVKPKCLACGRFIPRLNYRQRFPYCSAAHGERHLARLPGRGRRLALAGAPA